MSNTPPCMLDEQFELVQRGQGSPYQLKRMLKPAEIMLRPAETNVEWLRHPVEALGRVLALLQGLGGYTHGCTDAPPWRNITHSRSKTLRRPALTPSSAQRRHPQRLRYGAQGDYDLHRQLGVSSSLLLRRETPTLDQSSPTMLSGAPSRPRRANQDPHGQHPGHALEGSSLCRADAHPRKGSGATVGYHD